ncbi:MAG: TIGR04283 family arsenosugar biosynthesis glycosyltransferase [Luteolibacter sp.]
MTRLPRDGANKTRLIPALGSTGATAFHDRLARHTVGRASSYVMMHPSTCLQIHIDGGTPADGRAWLGEIDCHAQSEGDLGKRMQSAVDLAFSNGARRVMVIGTDCPSIDESLLGTAYYTLCHVDLVFGPAADGGYYLVGLSRPCPAIFREIEWGGPQVLNQSLAAACESEFETSLLEVHSDVDVPEDLSSASAVLTAGTSLSVIIPTLNEEVRLLLLLDRLLQCGLHEIIMADGGSHDRTMEIAELAGVRVISAKKGRASQMNRAAAMATGEFLLFLHADTVPPPEYQQIVTRLLQSPGTSAGAFRFGLTGELPSASLIEFLVNLRCRLLGTPYGDQGLFMRRRIFQHLGGYPDWPVMEDLHLVHQLKRLSPVRVAEEAARISSRRWKKYGLVRTFLSNQLMLAFYHLGLPAKFIARFRQ